MGSSEKRPRPPFNLAAGAGLAGPPGPCGLPGSVPALPANRTEARPAHSPSPAVPASTLTCPPLRTILHSTSEDSLQTLAPPTAPPPHSVQHPCSRRVGPSRHSDLPPPQRPPAAPRPHSPGPLQRQRGLRLAWAPSATESTYPRIHPRAHTQNQPTHVISACIHNTPTCTATNTSNTHKPNTTPTQPTDTQHTANLHHAHKSSTQHQPHARPSAAHTQTHHMYTHSQHRLHTAHTQLTPTPIVSTHIPINTQPRWR